jgi:hypothetical protein
MIRVLLGIRMPPRKLALEGQLTPLKGSNKAAELQLTIKPDMQDAYAI